MKPSSSTPLRRTQVTQRDLADHLGIGQVSVSRALADHPLVAPAMRDRVLAAAAALGYRRNASAKAMRTGRHGSIGLLLGCDPTRSALPADLLWGLQEDLRAQGLRLSLGWLTEAELEEPAVLAEWSVDGCLVYYTHDIPAGAPERLAALMPASLWLNADLPRDCVLPDERAASRQLGERLAGLGHRRAAFVGHGAGFSHYARDERRDGMRDHLAVEMVDVAEWGPGADWVDAAAAWLERARPSVVVGHEVDCVVPVHAAALRLGWRIPRDLSLAVFSNQDLSGLGLALSTLRVPSRELASQAVAGLLIRLAQPAKHLPPMRVPLAFHDAGTLGPPSSERSS